MTQDVHEEHVAFHGGDVSGPVESYVQMTQLPSVSVGELQRLVPSSRLQPLEACVRVSRAATSKSIFVKQRAQQKERHLRVKP